MPETITLNSLIQKRNLEQFEEEEAYLIEVFMQCNDNPEKHKIVEASEYLQMFRENPTKTPLEVYLNFYDSNSSLVIFTVFMLNQNQKIIDELKKEDVLKYYAALFYNIDIIYSLWLSLVHDKHLEATQYFTFDADLSAAPSTSLASILEENDDNEENQEDALKRDEIVQKDSLSLKDILEQKEPSTTLKEKNGKILLQDMFISTPSTPEPSTVEKVKEDTPKVKDAIMDRFKKNPMLSNAGTLFTKEDVVNKEQQKQFKKDLAKVAVSRTKFNVEEIARQLDESMLTISPMVAQSINRSTETWAAFQNLNEAHGMRDERALNNRIQFANQFFERKKANGELHGLAAQVGQMINDPRLQRSVDEMLRGQAEEKKELSALKEREFKIEEKEAREKEKNMTPKQRSIAQQARQKKYAEYLKMKMPSKDSVRAVARQSMMSNFKAFTEDIVKAAEFKQDSFISGNWGRSKIVRSILMIDNLMVFNPMPIMEVFALFTKILTKMTGPEIMEFMTKLINHIPKLPTAMEIVKFLESWFDKAYPFLKPFSPLIEMIAKYSQPVWETWATSYIKLYADGVQKLLRKLTSSNFQLKSEEELNKIFTHMIRLLSFLVRVSESFSTIYIFWLLKVVWWVINLVISLVVKFI